ncbi:MAG: hypothetical protein HY842_18180 [Bacteroidetes bacterium]|nr:hypothetical protein [Bacteroidota bacterium]
MRQLAVLLVIVPFVVSFLDSDSKRSDMKDYTSNAALVEDQYLVGDWDGDGKDNIAVRRGGSIQMDFNFDGNYDKEQAYGYGNSEDKYIVGDWDGDGRDNIAVIRWDRILMDFNFDGSHDKEQAYGNGLSTHKLYYEDEYLAGDWDGDGKDNIAVRRNDAILMDINFSGGHDIGQSYGNGNWEDDYLVGDWDGDGRDNIAVRRGGNVLMDFDFGGGHDKEQAYGWGNSENEYLVGDWDGDGKDNIAVRRGNSILMDFNFDGWHDKEQKFSFSTHSGSSNQIPVEFSINSLIADNTSGTSGDGVRDEVFIKVIGSTPKGHYSERLPRSYYGDDYYEFFNNQAATASNPGSWTNQDAAWMGKPEIWSGVLNNGESARFILLFLEQDNGDLDLIKKIVTLGLAALDTIPGVGSYLKMFEPLVNALPSSSNDDFLGAIGVGLTNENGNLKTTWLTPGDMPLNGEQAARTVNDANDPFAQTWIRAGENSIGFSMAGEESARYRGVASVKILDAFESTEYTKLYLGHTFDQCPEPILKVPTVSNGRYVRISPGSYADISITNNLFKWYCGGDIEWARAPEGTNLIVVSRSNSSTEIRWDCFKWILMK